MENPRYMAIEQALRDMREAVIDAVNLNPRMRAATKAVFDQRLHEAMDALNMDEDNFARQYAILRSLRAGRKVVDLSNEEWACMFDRDWLAEPRTALNLTSEG